MWTIETVEAGQQLPRAWIAPGGDIYVVGAADVYQRTPQGWRTLPRPASTLTSMQVGGVGDRAVFVTSQRNAWAYDGVRWMPVELPTLMFGVRSVTGSDRHIVFGMRYELLTSSGFAWSKLDASIAATENVITMWLASDDDIFAFTGSEAIRLRSGVRTTYPAPFVQDAWSAGSEIFAVSFSQAHRITDAGLVSEPFPNISLLAIAGEQPDRVYAGGQVAGATGSIIGWNGEKWSVVFPTARAVTSMWGSEVRGVFALADDRLYHHAPGALPTTWSEEMLPENGALAIWGDDMQLVVTTNSRRIYRRLHGAATWERLPHHLISRVKSLHGTTNDVFGVGDDGQLVHWDGVTWDQVRGPSHLGGVSSASSSANLTLLGGQQGVVRLFRPR